MLSERDHPYEHQMPQQTSLLLNRGCSYISHKSVPLYLLRTENTATEWPNHWKLSLNLVHWKNINHFWSDYGEMMMQSFLSYLEHLTAEAFPLLIRSDDTILVDEAWRTERLNILWSLRCPKNDPRQTLLPYVCIHLVWSWQKTNALLRLDTERTPSTLQHIHVVTYLLIPWKVLLAMSIMPPVGLATAPTRPLPTPLKKPAAPSFWAPAG